MSVSAKFTFAPVIYSVVKWKYSDNGTLSPRSVNAQRQWYPLPSFTAPHCTTDRWTIAYRTSRRLIFEELGNSEIIFRAWPKVIIGRKSIEDSIIPELNAEAEKKHWKCRQLKWGHSLRRCQLKWVYGLCTCFVKIGMEDSVIQKSNAEADRNIANNLMPAKSQLRYEHVYKIFIEWQNENKFSSFSEDILIVYFDEKAKKLKPSSLWSIYSMLRVTIKLNHNIDIADYTKLRGMLKAKGAGFVSKKSLTFTAAEMAKFLNTAPDWKYLDTKVNMRIKLIMGNLMDII